MRTLKFRAFDKRFKTMDYGSGDLLLRINSDDFSEPMQFTGLTDKNGKEIYESMQINNKYYVCWFFNRYVLCSISNSDIFTEILQYEEYEITGEYQKV